MNGPFDIQTLHLWHANGLIQDTTIIYEILSNEPIPLAQLLKEKGLYGTPPEEKNEWFLWTDQKNPYGWINGRLTKYFMSHRPKPEVKLLSIVAENYQLRLSNVQDFEDFLEQYTTCPREISEMHLNENAQPFAAWLHKTFTDMGIAVAVDELRNLLLESDFEIAKKFFFERIQTEKEALKIWNSYNQWRMFIPVYTVTE